MVAALEPYEPPPSDPYDEPAAPASETAEAQLLGLALTDYPTPDGHPYQLAVDAGITAASFYNPVHQQLWTFIAAVAADGRTPTWQNLQGEIAERQRDAPATTRALTQLHNNPGPYLHTLLDEAPSPDRRNVNAVVARIKRAHHARQLLALADRLHQQARNPASLDDADQLLHDWHEQHTAATDTSHAAWAPVDLTTILNGTHQPETATLIPRADGQHLFYAGRVHSMHGESESGKSLVAQAACAVEIRNGHHVLYIDWESDAATIVERLLLMGATPDQLATQLTYIHPDTSPHTDPVERAAWLRILDAEPTIAVLDGITDALTIEGRSTKDNDDLAAWFRAVPRRLATTTGAAVILIDHVTKDPDTRGRFAIGGQAKMNAIDGAAYTVEMTKPVGVGMAGTITLRIAKDRPGDIRPKCGRWRTSDRTQEACAVHISSEHGPIEVTWAPPNSHVTDAPSTDPKSGGFRPTVLMERVSRYLQDMVTEPISANALTDATGGKRQAVLTACRLLVAEGYANKTSKGLTHAKPYRRADDPLDDDHETGENDPDDDPDDPWHPSGSSGSEVVPQVVPGTRQGGGSGGSPPVVREGTSTGTTSGGGSDPTGSQTDLSNQHTDQPPF